MKLCSTLQLKRKWIISHKKGLKKFAVIIWFYAKMFVSPDQRNLKIYDNFGTEPLPDTTLVLRSATKSTNAI